MSRACYDCSIANPSACKLPGCLPGSGTKRTVIVANRQFPGPAIEVCKGDTIRLTIENNLDNEETTSIHFHGFTMMNNVYMDGTPMISQCPISPRNSFTLQTEASDAGSYFWHSHTGLQRTDGLAGPLIVRDSHDPHAHLYDVDNQWIMVQDWFDNTTATSLFATHHFAGVDNMPSSNFIVNGYGFGTFPDLATNFKIMPDMRHRFRMINNALLECPISVTLEGHNFVIIASDGQPVKAQATKQFVIFPAERVDFVPYFTGEYISPDGTYKLHLQGLSQCNQSNGLALFQYPNVKIQPVTAMQATKGDNNDTSDEVMSVLKIDNGGLNATMLDNFYNDTSVFERNPDIWMVIDMDIDPVGDERMGPNIDIQGIRPYTSRLNQLSFKFPPAPLNSQMEDIPTSMYCNVMNRHCEANQHCPCINMISVPLGALVEIIFVDNARTFPGAFHPMHIHGHRFHVLASQKLHDNLSTDEVITMDNGTALPRKAESVLIKDTVVVPSGGYVITRFYANNPGIWMLHCHNDYHMVTGMAMVINVGTHEEKPKVPKDFPTCIKYDNEINASVFNKQSHLVVVAIITVINVVTKCIIE